MRFEQKVAVVVGAGQTAGTTIGNGRATSILLAREGARVVCVDRDLDSAAETVAMIEDEGGAAMSLRADITAEDDCASIPEAAVDTYGGLDVLINNVGIGAGVRSATKLELESWERIHEVNVTGMWLTCKHVLPVMRSHGRGVIVNVSSVGAVCAMPTLAYKVSKAAVNALTHQLAMSAAPHGIRVNGVMPGLIDTPMAVEGISSATGADPDDVRAARDAMVPLGRHQGTAWDVADAIAFLASDDAAFITAVSLPVDGGQSARIG